MLSAVSRPNPVKLEETPKATFNGDSKPPPTITAKPKPIVDSNGDISLPSSRVAKNALPILPSNLDSKSLKVVEKAGFASLPNQIHRKAVRRGFVFNVMVTGAPGLGKSTFINALFCSDLYDQDYPGPSRRHHPPGTTVETKTFKLSEADVHLRLSLVDTPGYAQDLDNSSCWKPLVKSIDSRFESYLRSELSVSRSTVGSGAPYQPSLPDDNRIHVCFYFVNPTGHGLHQLDIEALKQLHRRVNVVLIIGKADSLTTEECAQFKKTINDELAQNDIHLYDFPEAVVRLGGTPEPEWVTEVQKARSRQPFAVVCSDRLVQLPDGRKVRGRVYPWGIVETDNLAHNDFSALKNLVLSVHLQDLIDVTHQVHYSNYFGSRLTSIAEASKFPAAPDSREPLCQLEAERNAYQRKLAILEADMEKVFEQKVQERTAKLNETEHELEQRAAQLDAHLSAQLAEFERQRLSFEDERAIWEAENRETIENLQSTMDKSDLKDKFRIKRKGFF